MGKLCRKDIPDIPNWLIENLMTVVSTSCNTRRFREIEQVYEHIGKRFVTLGVSHDERCFFRGTDNPEYQRILWHSEHPKRIMIDSEGNTILATSLHAYLGCLVLFTHMMNNSRWHGYFVLDVPSNLVQTYELTNTKES
ncbi:MAG: hypothetical protein QXY15_04555 [Candidatus Nitrosotenuis sp.]